MYLRNAFAPWLNNCAFERTVAFLFDSFMHALLQRGYRATIIYEVGTNWFMTRYRGSIVIGKMDLCHKKWQKEQKKTLIRAASLYYKCLFHVIGNRNARVLVCLVIMQTGLFVPREFQVENNTMSDHKETCSVLACSSEFFG